MYNVEDGERNVLLKLIYLKRLTRSSRNIIIIHEQLIVYLSHVHYCKFKFHPLNISSRSRYRKFQVGENKEKIEVRSRTNINLNFKYNCSKPKVKVVNYRRKSRKCDHRVEFRMIFVYSL